MRHFISIISSLYIFISITALWWALYFIISLKSHNPAWLYIWVFAHMAYSIAFCFQYSKGQKTSELSQLSKETNRKTKKRDKKIVELEDMRIRENYRREFIGNLAHELRTPLFTAQSYVLTLLDGAIKDKSIRGDYLLRISNSIDRLIYVVEDLSLITELESGMLKIETKEFNLRKFIREVVELCEMDAKSNDISISIDESIKKTTIVKADIYRIEQVLINLISNSIRHGRKDGKISIYMSQAKKQDKIWIHIKDNGPGIHPKHLPRIFERFYRIDQSRSRTKGGSGLGLAIVKHIIEAHGQEIKVNSLPNVGSEFIFSLTLSN